MPAGAGGVGDADREDAVRQLSEAYARGELEHDEFSRRLDAAFAATSADELAAITPATTNAGAPPQLGSPSSAEATRLSEHLSSGERVLWIGHPDPRKRFTKQDAFLIPFTVLWGGFAIFWESLAIAGGGGPGFALSGAVFVAVGLYMIFGRFIYKAYRKRRTTYAVTTRRVLSVVDQSSGPQVESCYLRALPRVATTIGPDGVGSIEMSLVATGSGWYGNNGMELFARGNLAGGVNFYDIPQAREVAALIEQLRGASS